MTTKVNLPANIDLVAFKAVIGAPVLLSTERVDAYDAMFAWFIESLKPRDAIQLFLVQQVVQETWKILRYQRHQTLGTERRVRVSAELQKRLRAERAAKLEARSETSQPRTERPATELLRMRELCNEIETTAEDVETLAEGGKLHHREFMQNKAFEEGMEFQERLDRLIGASTEQIDMLLGTYDHCQYDLAQRTRKLSREIIDADVVELENPSSPRMIEAINHQSVVGEQDCAESFEAPAKEEDVEA